MKPASDRPQHRNLVWLTIQMLARMAFAIWFRYRIRGLEHIPKQGAALLLINHQSFLDPLLVPLWFRRPVSFLARDNLFEVPVVGWVLRATYVIPIKRESPGRSSVQASISRLQHGNLLGIFPEGTRTVDGQVGPFRPGFVMTLKRCPVPVIPVGIDGADQAMPRGSLWIRPKAIRVVVGEPIPPSQFADLQDRERESQWVETIRQRVIDCQQQAERM